MMKMNLLLALVLLLLPVAFCYAQNDDLGIYHPQFADSTNIALVDSLEEIAYSDEEKYEMFIGGISDRVSIPVSVEDALYHHILKNKSRKNTYYRIRIFFNNSRDARNVSETIANTFTTNFPEVPVYRIYSAPYFKVTVGDFKTKSDAMRFMEMIRPQYPAVFLVKESSSTI